MNKKGVTEVIEGGSRASGTTTHILPKPVAER